MYEYLVEFLGTMFFAYVVIATGNPLAIGAALALAILLTQKVSGGHINPAITIALAAKGGFPSTQVVPYCLSQILGALVALELYKRFSVSA